MLRPWLQSLAAALPSRCAVCGAWPAAPVCQACLDRFARHEPRCRCCALPLPAGVQVCGLCLREPPLLDACIAAVPYAYPWAGLIGRFKFQQEPGWAASFADLLAQAPGARQALAGAELVLPMPLSPQRLAQRGFNQALEIARRLAPAKTESALLLRLRDTAPQSALTRAQRLANVRGAFAVDPLRAGELQGRRVLLLDDVMTSGASLFAAAQAVRAAGAAQVAALVLARTAGPD